MLLWDVFRITAPLVLVLAGFAVAFERDHLSGRHPLALALIGGLALYGTARAGNALGGRLRPGPANVTGRPPD